MTMPSLLDELVFAQPSLTFTPPPVSVNLSLAFEVKGSTRKLQFGMPWFLRQPLQQILAARWPAFCGRIRAHRIPMFCRVDQFEQVAASQLPIRLARRELGQPFNPQELRTADALELDCFNSAVQCWQWPLELVTKERLNTFVQAVRDATSSLSPIGLSLPSGASNADLEFCIEAACDFVTLVSTETESASNHAIMVEGLTRARDLFQSAGAQIPILVVLPIRNAEHALKLLAVGASAVCIDSLVNPLIKDLRANSSLLAGGMLSGINLSSQAQVDVPEIEPTLVDLRQRLETCLRRHACSSIAALGRNSLRGTTDRACQLARVECLG